MYLIPQWFKCDGETVLATDTPESGSPPSLLGWRDLKGGIREKRRSPPSMQQIQALCQVLFVGVPMRDDSLGDSDEEARQKERVRKALEHLTSRLVGLAMDVAALMRLFCGGGGDVSQLRALLLVLQGLLLSAGEASMKDPRGSRYRRKDESEMKEGTERGMHDEDRREKVYMSTRTRSHFQQLETLLKDLRGLLLDLIGRRIAGDKQQGADPLSSLGQFPIDATGKGLGELRLVAEGLESLSRHLVPSDDQGATPASQDSGRASTPSLRNQLLQSAYLLRSLLSSPAAAGRVSPSDAEAARGVGSGPQSERSQGERAGRFLFTGTGKDGGIRSPTGTGAHQERRPPIETVGPDELLRLLSGNVLRRLFTGTEGHEETRQLGGTAEDEQRRLHAGTGSDKDKRWTFAGTGSYEERRPPSDLESYGVRRSLTGPARGPRIVWTVGKGGIRPAGVYTPGHEGKGPLISTGGDDGKTIFIDLVEEEERRPPSTGEEQDKDQGGDEAEHDWVYKIVLNLDNSALQKQNEELEESLANKRKRLEEALKEAAVLRWLCQQLADWNGSHKKRSELLDSLVPLLRRLRALQGILKKCSCLYHRDEDKLGGLYDEDDDGTPDSKSGGGQGFKNVSKIVREPVVPDVQPVGYADNVFFASLRSSSPPIRLLSRSPSGTPGGGSRSPRSMSPSPSRLLRDKSLSFKKTLESRDGSEKRGLSLTPPVLHASSLPSPSNPEHADRGTSIQRSKTTSPSGRKASSPSFSRDHSTGRKSGEAQAGSGGGVRTPRSPRASSVRGSSPRPTSPSAFSAAGERGGRSGRLPVPGSGGEGTSRRRNVSAPPTGGGGGEARGKQQEEDKNKKKKPTVPALSLKVLTTRRSRSPSPSNASSVVQEPSPRRSRKEKTDDTCSKSPKEPGRGVTESKTKSRSPSKEKEEQARRKLWRISSSASSGGSSSHSFSFEDFVKRGGSRDSNVSRRTDSKNSDVGGSALDQGGEGDPAMDGTGQFPGGDLQRLFALLREDWNSDDPSTRKTELEVYRQIVAFLDKEENQRVIPPDYNNEAVKKCVNVKHLLPSSAKGSLSLALEDPNEMKPEERKLRTMVSFIDGLTKLLAKTNKEDPVLPLIKPLIQCGEQGEVEQCDLSIHFGLERLRRLLLLLRHKGRSGGPLCPSLDEKEEFLKVYGPFIGLEQEDIPPTGDRGVCGDETATPLGAEDQALRLPGVFRRGSLGGEEGGDGVKPYSSSKSLRRDDDGCAPPCENLPCDQQTGEVRVFSQEGPKKKPSFPTLIISADGQTKVITSHDFSEDDSNINDLQDTDKKTKVEALDKVSHSEKEGSGDSHQGRKGEGDGEVKGGRGEGEVKEGEGKAGGSRSSKPGDLHTQGGVVPGAEDHGSEGGLPAGCANGPGKKGNEKPPQDGRIGERGTSHDGVNGLGEAAELSSSDSSSSLHLHLPPGGMRVIPDLQGLSQYGPVCLDATQFPAIPPLQNLLQSRSNVASLSGPLLTRTGGGKLPAPGATSPGLHAFRNGPLGRLPSTTFSVLSSSTHEGGGPVSGNSRDIKLGEDTASGPTGDSRPREPGSSMSSSTVPPLPFALLPPWLQALPEDFDVSQLRTTPPPPFSILPAPRTSSSGSLEGTEQHQQASGGEEKGGSCGRSDSSGSATLGRSPTQRLRWVPCLVWAPCPVAEGDDDEKEEEKETPGRDGVSSSPMSAGSPGVRTSRITQVPRQGGVSKGVTTLSGHEKQQQAGKADMMSPRSRLKKGGVEYEGRGSVSSPRSMFSPRTLSPRSATALQQSGSAGGSQGGSSSPRRSSGPQTALRRGSQQGGREDGQRVGGAAGQGKGDEQRGRQVDMRRRSVNREGMPEIFVREVGGSHPQGRGGEEDGMVDKGDRSTTASRAGQRYYSPGNVDSLSRRGMSLQDHRRRGEQEGEGASGRDIAVGSQPVHAKTHPVGSVTIRRVSLSREPSTMMGRSEPGSPRGKEGESRLMNEVSGRRRGDVNDSSGKSENSSDQALSSPTRTMRLSFHSKSRGEREVDGEDDRALEGGKSRCVYSPPRSAGSGGVYRGYEGLLLRDQTIDEDGAGADSPRVNGFMSREGRDEGWTSGHYRTRGDSCTSIGDEFLEEGGRGGMGGSAWRQWTGKMSLDGDGDYHHPRPMVGEGEGIGGGRGGEGERREDDEGDEDEETLKELLAQTIRDLENLDHEIYFTERIAREADEIAKEKAAEKDELEKRLEEEEKKGVADEDDEEDEDDEGGGDDEELGLEDDGEEEEEEEDDEEGAEEEGDEEEEDNDDADVGGAAAGSDDGLEKSSDGSSSGSSNSVPSLSTDTTKKKKKKSQGGEEGDTEDDVFSALRKIDGQVKKAASWADSSPKKRLASGEYDDKVLRQERSSSSIGSPKSKKEISRTDSSRTTTKTDGSSLSMKGMSRSASLGKPGRKGSKKMVKLSKKRTMEEEAGSSSTKTRPLKRSATMAPTRSHHPLERKATKKVPASGAGGGASAKKKKTKKKTKGSGAGGSKGSHKDTTNSDGSKKKRSGATGAGQQRGGKKKLSRKKKKRLARKAKLAEAARQAAQTAAIAADAPRVLRAHIIMKQEKAKALREQLEAKKARLEQLLKNKQAEHHQLQSGLRGPGGGVRRMTADASLSVPGGGGSSSSSSRSPILPRYMRSRQLDASPQPFDGRSPRTPSLSPSPSFRSPTRFSSTNVRSSRGLSVDEEGGIHRRSTSASPGGWLGSSGGSGSMYGGGGMRRATVSPVLGGSGHESSHMNASPDYYNIPNTFWNTGGGIVKWRRPSEEPKPEPEPRMIPKRKSAVFERVRPKTYVLSEGKGLGGGGIVRSYKDWVRMYYGEEKVREIWGELAKGPEETSSSPPEGLMQQEGENQSSKEGELVAEDEEAVPGQKNGHTPPLEQEGGRPNDSSTLDGEGPVVIPTADEEQHEEKKTEEGNIVVNDDKAGKVEEEEEEDVSEEKAQKEEQNVMVDREMNDENKKTEEKMNGEHMKIGDETNGENRRIEEETNEENKKIEDETNTVNEKVEEVAEQG